MWGYHLFIAWKSIRRTPGNSLIILAGIALGVTVATMFSAIYHAYARDPIPEKSRALHYVRLDSWDPQRAFPDGGIPPQITYRDMKGIMRSDIPIRQTGAFMSAFRVALRGEGARRAMFRGRYCHGDFFAMFDVPFRHGAAWDRKADEAAEQVVVLDEELNDQWFGGENSVGRLLTIEGRDFRVVGVLDRWQPFIKFYDLTRVHTDLGEHLFIPTSVAETLQKWSNGTWQTWKQNDQAGPATGEAAFVQMWVELAGPKDVAAYHDFLDAYALEQRRIGRFQRPLDNRVTPLLEYMEERGCTPPEAAAIMIAANCFLAACSLGLMGLILARFLSRSAEIGVRRALGARRRDIFAQHIIESAVMGLAGGLLGLALARAGLWLVNMWALMIAGVERESMFRLDLTMVGFAVGASLVAGLLAGIYPAYRVCRIAPAIHLKVQ